MTFKDLVKEKKTESREAFTAMMRERRKRIDAGESRAEVETDLLAKNQG